MKYTTFNQYSNTFVFDTWIEGPTISIFWWIHWNETVWIKVINKIVDKINSKKIKLLKWRLILAYWNEKALEIWERGYKYDLNRLFKPKYFESDSDDYEIKRVKQLKDILDVSDILLDIHSVSSDSEPFIFSENINSEVEIVKKICDTKVIVWWWDIWWNLLSWDTDSYMHSIWKIAYTFECGNHYQKKAFQNWFIVANNLLSYFELILPNIKYNKLPKSFIIEMYKIATTKTWNFVFEKEVENFHKIKKWELIWIDWIEKVYAEEDFFVLLPNYWKLEVWDDIYYYWRIK